jgi:hypothetical protein
MGTPPSRAVLLLRPDRVLDPDSLEPVAILHDDGVWRTPEGVVIDALTMPTPKVHAHVTDEALRAHHAAVDEAWLLAALPTVAELAETHETLTTDEVRARVPAPRDARAGMSTLMNRAKRAGVIAWTAETRQSVRASNGGRPVRVWRSLRYRGPQPQR